jgi:hypothetical protein
VLAGLILIGAATGGALAADVYPTVRDAYNANTHTTVRSLQPFNTVNVSDDTDIRFRTSDKYYVALNYFGDPNINTIKTSVHNGTLLIDSGNFDQHRNCHGFCVPETYNMVVTVYSPNALQLEMQDMPKPVPAPESPKPPVTP